LADKGSHLSLNSLEHLNKPPQRPLQNNYVFIRISQ